MKKSLNGKKVKIIGNTTTHQFKIGEFVTIVNDGGMGGHPYNLTAQGEGGMTYNIGHKDFMYKFGLEQIQEQIDEIEAKREEINDQMKYWLEAKAFLENTGSKEFEETEYKAYQVLKTIDSDTSDIDKAKLIAKIVNG